MTCPADAADAAGDVTPCPYILCLCVHELFDSTACCVPHCPLVRLCCCVACCAQEYTEEFRDITKGTKSKESLPVAPITLINQRPVGDDLHVRNSKTVTFL